MRKIKCKTIINAVKYLCAKSNFELPEDVLKSLIQSINLETGVGRDILKEIIANAKIAKKLQYPLCQDTGVANFFVKLGNDVCIEQKSIYYAINKGVSLGYISNYLRKSIVSDPIKRTNTKNNTPANIYIDIVSGNKIEIVFFPKGGGSENASELKMLTPSVGWKGIKEFILDVINNKAENACPPLIIGIGIGGDFASVGLLSKKALLREIGSVNPNKKYFDREQELLNDINKLGIGPMGIGGKVTALAVFIESKPTHISSLPVAVNIQCHSHRKKMIII
ncbi:MAG: fumarate hydratase [Endomicrobium sp.]|jgi:fumarate hydratase subunit alpha|nr:fumarate hydratase [Endomicrobium sp.]